MVTLGNRDDYVTAVITHLVKPGREEGYEAWIQGIVPIARGFEGHLGVQILRPQPGSHREYIVVLHFDCHEHLQGWLQSNERREWIERVQPLIEGPENVQALTGWETWFELPGRSPQSAPKRYKMALITWLGVLFLSTLISSLLHPLLVHLPGLLRQAIVVAIVVWLLAYWVMPQLTRLLHRWLYPS